jgi:hypothetical protein
MIKSVNHYLSISGIVTHIVSSSTFIQSFKKVEGRMFRPNKESVFATAVAPLCKKVKVRQCMTHRYDDNMGYIGAYCSLMGFMFLLSSSVISGYTFAKDSWRRFSSTNGSRATPTGIVKNALQNSIIHSDKKKTYSIVSPCQAYFFPFKSISKSIG